jgi:hypothetical protein
MAEYGEGDTGIYFSSIFASISLYFVYIISITTPFTTSLLYRLTIALKVQIVHLVFTIQTIKYVVLCAC